MPFGNDLKQNQYLVSSSRSISKLLQQKWLIVVIALMLTGLGAAIAGVLFKAGVETLDTWRLKLLEDLPAWIVLPALGGVGGFISGTLITKLAPAASGSGITHIMAFIRHRPVPMGLKVGLVKLIAGIIAIGSGFPLGPEGPSVQMGGSVAWQMAKWLKAPIAFRRVIVAAGGGAGIAAVFSAPLGGFIYAIEELLNSARPVVLLLVIVTTFIADSSAIFLQGGSTEATYKIDFLFSPNDFIYLVILGLIIGIFAEFYCKYVLMMQNLGKKLYQNKFILKMSMCGFILGIIYSLLGDEFHDLDKLKKIIATQNIDISINPAQNIIVWAILVVFILFITSGLAAATGAPGGLFYPMLILGGATGLIIGSLMPESVPSTYVFAGMGAFVAGCSRTPITAMFLAFALTKNLIILKPVLISCITSFLIARLFDKKSIYERQIEIEVEN